MPDAPPVAPHAVANFAEKFTLTTKFDFNIIMDYFFGKRDYIFYCHITNIIVKV
jgi:hypothetical protein